MKKYWTKEKVFEESKKYKTRTEFARNSKSAYMVAWSNKWLEEMSWLELTIIKWNDEMVINESKKYKTRSEFEKGSGSAYYYARVNKLLDQMIWLKHPKEFEIYAYYIYVYEDEKNKVAYVGLTRNKNERHFTHSNSDKSPVYKYFSSIYEDVPEPKYLETGLNCDEAREKEDYWKNIYYDNGYTMLNKGKTGLNSGSLGGVVKKWSKKKVFEESKKYTSKKKFEKGSLSAIFYCM